MMIDLGAVDLPQDRKDAKLEPVLQAGVALMTFMSAPFIHRIGMTAVVQSRKSTRWTGDRHFSNTQWNGGKCKILQDLEKWRASSS
nr:hypothetical protein [Cylindrospermopsis raciborskii]